MKKFFNKLLKNCDLFKGKANGFTLAEVLITLGIIGVVAALTIPTLMANYKAKERDTRYQKAKATLANGFKMMMANENVDSIKRLCYWNDCNGNPFEKTFKLLDSDWNTGYDDEFYDTEYSVADSENKIHLDNDTNNYYPDITFRTADNTIFQTCSPKDWDWDSGYPDYIGVKVDLNGSAKPNKVGEDLVMFRVSGNGVVTDITAEELLSDGDIPEINSHEDLAELLRTKNTAEEQRNYCEALGGNLFGDKPSCCSVGDYGALIFTNGNVMASCDMN